MIPANSPARLALAASRGAVGRVATSLAERARGRGGKFDAEKLDAHQPVAFDLAISTAELFAAEAALVFAESRHSTDDVFSLEEALAERFLAESIVAIRARFAPIPSESGLALAHVEQTLDDPAVIRFVERALSPDRAETIVEGLQHRPPERGLTEDERAFGATFRSFADSVVLPRAEAIHRGDLLVPPEIVDGLKSMGVFGLSIPQSFGGIRDDDHADDMGMVVVTEELSRASLAAAGSLITRPEILAKAILEGGTDEQKKSWLPRLASGDAMVAVAVTEPDYGSDVAAIKVGASRVDGGWRIDGVKTWCTFAGFANTLAVLARTDPDPKKGHKGLSLFIAEKPSFDGHSFECTQPGGGKMTGKSIATIGYRGMHSFEVSFEGWQVPAENLVGGDAGLGRGFYLQMAGFAGGRLQTAARALGVMQAALDSAVSYARERRIFGSAEIEMGLTRLKLARMCAALETCRQGTYRAARRGAVDTAVGAAMAKLLACRMAEWVTREAMQLHGGMGYAEEFPVSRYFVDARVLSIFEGAEEVLALRVIARSVVEAALPRAAHETEIESP